MSAMGLAQPTGNPTPLGQQNQDVNVNVAPTLQANPITNATGGTGLGGAGGVGLGGTGLGGTGMGGTGLGGLGGTGGLGVGGVGGAGGASVNEITIKHERSAASASAPLTTGSNGTCMGSTGIGAQGVSFGVSVGSTWNDENCNRRYDAIRLAELGLERAAIALMCQSPAVRKAMLDADTPCPERHVKLDPEARVQEPTDPYVRRRLGLP